MSDWQPIETAPKDGTLVLFACPKRVGYSIFVGFMLEGDGFIVRGDTNRFRSFPGEWQYSATHWMPLPPPPKEQP